MTERAVNANGAGSARTVRVFAAGAGIGFLAGAFVACAVVWQYGNVIGSRAANRAHPPETPTAVERWVDGIDDAGDAVVQADAPATVATSGEREPSPVAKPSPSSEAVIGAVPADELADRDLVVPVQGVTSAQLIRSFTDRRGSARVHEAIDIQAPIKTPVLAVDAGSIARLFYSKAGGITIYQFDPSERFCYYYAHLDHYAPGLREGQRVTKGEVIGYVGISGNAPKDTPHLHFAVFRLTEAKRWWEGTALDPYDILK